MICADSNFYHNQYQADAAQKNSKLAKQDQNAYRLPIKKKIVKSLAPLMKASLQQYQAQILFTQAAKKV